MAAGQTLVSDIIVPAIFLPYVVQRTAQLSAIAESGIMSVDPQFSELVAATPQGQTVNLPFWNDINDADQVVDDSTPLTTNKITASQDIAVIFERGVPYSVNDLATMLSGSDGLKTIMDLYARYWMRRTNDMIFAFLKGIFAAASMAPLISNIAVTGATVPDSSNYFTGQTFIAAKQLLGDNKFKLTAIAIHSATEAWLDANDLIDFIPQSDSEGVSMKPQPQYQGLRVITDDSAPVAFTSTLVTNGTNPTDGDTIVIPGATVNNQTFPAVTYRFKTVPAAINDIYIGGSAAVTLGSLVKAINGTGTAGTDYFAGTVVNPLASAGAVTSSTTSVLTVYTAYTASTPTGVTQTGSTFTITNSTSYLQFTSYLFGEGAIGWGIDPNDRPAVGAPPPSTWMLEYSRNALSGQSILTNRRRFILHARGIKWTGASMTGKSPSNADLMIGSNWQLVYEVKNVRIVAFVHNIGTI